MPTLEQPSPRRVKRRDVQRLFKKHGIKGHHAGEFQNLIDRANRQGWSSQQFKHQVVNSKAFDERFPGIKGADGGLKITPAEYDAQSEAYQQQARLYNIRLNKKQMGTLIEENVSPQEVTDRFTAIQRFKEYEPALKQFIQALESRGQKVPAKMKTTDGLINFILGQGPHEFYRFYEEATIGTAAYRAGFDATSPMNKFLKKQIPGMMSESELQAHFKNMATTMREAGSLSQVYGMGLSKRDLAVLEFGGRTKKGKTQSEIAGEVERIMKTAEAFETEKRGQQETGIGQRGQGEQSQ